ncbi:MAG TPA: tetratricopeptide repeat protein [Pirellulales bacterium]|nr:tetratricopeptide repeat protein [Pirellulales bacterium]
MATTNELLAQGRQWHQAGDLRRAEPIYRQVIEQDPECFEARQLLAMLCQAQGRLDEAASHYQQALQFKPDDASTYNSLGICQAMRQDRDAAAASFRRAIELKPDFAHAHSNLGNIYKELGRLPQAVECYQQAVLLKPDFAEALNNLGNLLRELKNLDAAASCCREAVRLKPDFADAQNNLGAVLVDQGRREEAESCFRRAIALKPYFAEAHNNLGNLLREAGRNDEAIFNLREAVRQRPDFAEAHAGLAMALLDRGSFDEAAASCRRAIELRPDRSDSYVTLGFIRSEQGQREAALAAYQQALDLKPDHAEAHKNRSLVWLLEGKLAEGWTEYEWRWKCPELPERPFPQPLWDGSPLDGRTILLHAEQGLGDTIQFIRYAPLVRDRGGKVVVVCQKPLVALLASCPGIERIVAQGDTLPAFDVHAPLASLPRIFGTTLETIPADVPYLAADERLVERWSDELPNQRSFEIGIAWQGSPKYRWDAKRSIPLEQFEPLARVPGVQLYSLQKGPGSEQLARVASRFAVVDFGGRLDESTGPFLDTAAVMKNLDLVITSDTSIPHLAGALGVPVWLAASDVPDWRWLVDRDDSPWYPTMRLFRQPSRGDWQSVFRRMAEELDRMVAGGSGVSPAATPQKRRRHAPTAASTTIEVAPGELLDKLTILEIKSERIADPAKLANVGAELATLVAARDRAIPDSAELAELCGQLKSVNLALWDVEDEIRLCERDKNFGARFVELARSVYRHNDRRAALKRQINELLGSKLIEEKDYAPYES